MTFCKYPDDTRKSDSFNQVNEVKSFGKCKWLPGMCPHKSGCILPHRGGPSSQCKIDAPIFCPEYVRFVIKFAKGAHYGSRLNWGEFQKSATWNGHVGLHFCFSTTLDFHLQHPLGGLDGLQEAGGFFRFGLNRTINIQFLTSSRRVLTHFFQIIFTTCHLKDPSTKRFDCLNQDLTLNW